MKKLQQIYKDYQIKQNLADHQLRVAAVAKLICDKFKVPLNCTAVVQACLFHDMGNIIKFDLRQFPEFLQPEGVEYWREVQDQFIRKYGPDEHQATKKIGRELGLSDEALGYLGKIEFSALQSISDGDSFEQKICSYADARVGPYGVLSVDERLRDGKKRYEGRVLCEGELYEKSVKALKEIEKQIFAKIDMKPENIDDQSIEKIVSELRNS